MPPGCTCPLGTVCRCGAWQRHDEAMAQEVLADAAAQDNEMQTLRGLLKECREYVGCAHDDAKLRYEGKDESGSEAGDLKPLQEMQRAGELLARIDAHIHRRS